MIQLWDEKLAEAKLDGLKHALDQRGLSFDPAERPVPSARSIQPFSENSKGISNNKLKIAQLQWRVAYLYSIISSLVAASAFAGFLGHFINFD